jgi:hypothetical protein
MPMQSNYGATTAMNVGSMTTLASSVTGAGYCSALVSNGGVGNGSQHIRVYCSFTLTAPTTAVPFISGGTITMYLIQAIDTATPPTIVTDAVYAAGNPATPLALAAGTLNSAPIIQSITISQAAGQVYTGSFVIRNPGPYWTIAVSNATGVAFTAASIKYVSENITTLL